MDELKLFRHEVARMSEEETERHDEAMRQATKLLDSSMDILKSGKAEMTDIVKQIYDETTELKNHY